MLHIHIPIVLPLHIIIILPFLHECTRVVNNVMNTVHLFKWMEILTVLIYFIAEYTRMGQANEYRM